MPRAEIAPLAECAERHASLFLRACRREPTPRPPIWLMRQAGRYMPEYRAVRGRVGFLELCKSPPLAAEVTITAQQRLGVDAAILFADILLVLEAMGLHLEFTAGDGPVLHNRLRSATDISALRAPEPGSLGYVAEAVRLIRAGLASEVPLIGFAGSPFTLASYAIEGGGSRNYENTKALLHGQPGLWDELMDRLARAVADYLLEQIAAGADAVQLFDSWVGCLSPSDYRRSVAPHSRTVITAVKARYPTVPVIHFGAGNPALLPAVAEAGGDVIGIDYRIELDKAWDLLGGPCRVGVQGNLDPAILLADRATVLSAAEGVLARAAGRAGHIFNLGHGLLPATPMDNVLALVERVKSASVGNPSAPGRAVTTPPSRS